jgi:predicted metal-dependent phosphoesterase TrpH
MSSLRGRVITPATFESYVKAGLDGIEVMHRDHTAENRTLLANIADEFGLVKTGSSDYHGNGKLNQLAEFHTAPLEFEKLEARSNQPRVIRR